MPRTSTTSLGIRGRGRILSSPAALAFVRAVGARRGASPAEARKSHIEYLNRSRQADNRGQREAA
jgi:hypothetical protein